MARYDVAIIGAGPAGYVAAIYAARAGKSVAVIEKDLLGGTCLNKGCIPTKALLSSVAALCLIREAPLFGINASFDNTDFNAINRRKADIVKRLRDSIAALFKARAITLFNGHGRLAGPGSVEISSGGVLEGRVEAKDIIIAPGSNPLEIPAFKFNHTNILSSDDILGLAEVPKELVIVGAGAVGCEFAVIYNALGCRVTLVEMADEILPNTDRELAKKLGIILKKSGIKVFTGAEILQIRQNNGGVSAVLASGEEIPAEKALISIGRRPAIEDMGIDTVGIKAEGGRIPVNEYMRTSAPNIYAAGDITNKFQLAHVASYEAITACENILGRGIKADYRAVPRCVYAEPYEAATVGLSEEAAAAAGIDIKVARFPFLGLGMAHAAGRTEGFVKLIGEKPAGRIVGVHILGAGASDLIAEAVLAIRTGITIEELSRTIHAHPTFAEGLMEAAHIFGGMGIHTL